MLSLPKYAKMPLRYSAAIPDDIIFNHEIVLNVMTISRKLVLQIVDIGTRFTVTRFLSDKSSETIWSPTLQSGVLPCTGVPHIIRHDQGSEVVSQTFKAICRSHGIVLKGAPSNLPGPWELENVFMNR